MTLHGKNFIGNSLSAEGEQTLTASNPATGAALDGAFVVATATEIDRAVNLASQAFPAFRALSAEVRATFLEAIAEEILAIGDSLLERANAETGLPLARLTGERGRTVGQLKLFANIVREGSWVQAKIDPALPDRKPLPRPDLRRMLIPIGPVAVFGASNFPFAFSVAGGDTASALAAGCPVIVKAHPAHPGVSEMTAAAILRAAERVGAPEGVFSLVHGVKEVGIALVEHPRLEAVAFTGSHGAGMALFNAAAARPRPIPVFAEMGSVNPVFLLPGALAERGEALATGLAQSITLGVGQFCTNPGLVAGVSTLALDTFTSALGATVSAAPPGVMLHQGISSVYAAGVKRLAGTGGVVLAAEATGETAPAGAHPALLTTSAANFIANHAIGEENFGPSSVLVSCDSRDELLALAEALDGQLTASIHGTERDFVEYRKLIHILETKVGRLIFNGYPTGVEVSYAMQHGGPYPSTTDSRTTSVGGSAIERFVRPLCYQDTPDLLLPDELRNENVRSIWRLIDGKTTQEAVNG